MKNRKMNPAALAAALIGAAALFGAAGCDDGSSPKLCVCPNGTVHENFGCECGGVNCVCTHTLYHLNYGITLEDQTGGALTEGHIAVINEYLDEIYNFNALNMTTLANKGLKFTIVSGIAINRNGSTISVGIENITNALDLGSVLISYVDEVLLSISNFNPAIRLVNGEPPDDAASVTHFSHAKAAGHAAASWTAPVPLRSAAGGEAGRA
jgi:hypothetical protein